MYFKVLNLHSKHNTICLRFSPKEGSANFLFFDHISDCDSPQRNLVTATLICSLSRLTASDEERAASLRLIRIPIGICAAAGSAIRDEAPISNAAVLGERLRFSVEAIDRLCAYELESDASESTSHNATLANSAYLNEDQKMPPPDMFHLASARRTMVGLGSGTYTSQVLAFTESQNIN